MLGTNISFTRVTKPISAIYTTVHESVWLVLIIGDTELTIYGNGGEP